MKKSILLLALLISSISSMAATFGSNYEQKRNQFGIELGIGGNGDTAADLGVKWQVNFTDNISWDAITLKAIANLNSDFSKSIVAEALTGPRFTSPEFGGGMTAYCTAKAGCAIYTNSGDTSFAYEAGAGVNLTNNIYLGYAFNGFKLDGVNVKYHTFRIGFVF